MKNYLTNPTTLPALLRQVATELADLAVTYLLAGHYYDRTNHPRYRHFPAVFALQQGEVSRLEVGVDFVAFDTELIRYPEETKLPTLVPGLTAFGRRYPSRNSTSFAAKC